MGQYDMNTPADAVIGIDVGGTKMFGVVADLAGNIQHEIYRPHGRYPKTEGFAWLTELIRELLDVPRPENQQIRGICIGVPSITLSSQGIVKWAPTFGWRDFPLRDELAKRFDLPIFVENDVNLATLGEWGFGAGQGMQNIVCMFIGTGIGGGVIINGQLYRGNNQAAGEIGWMVPDRAMLRHNAVEGFGGLESLASGKGIAERANRQRSQERPLTASDVFAAARDGESWAEAVIEETADYLSIGVANISALLDPAAIIIGGGVAEAGDLLIDPVRHRLEQVIQYIPEILQAKLGKYAPALGAVTRVLETITEL
jgi:glucokinase